MMSSLEGYFCLLFFLHILGVFKRYFPRWPRTFFLLSSRDYFLEGLPEFFASPSINSWIDTRA